MAKALTGRPPLLLVPGGAALSRLPSPLLPPPHPSLLPPSCTRPLVLNRPHPAPYSSRVLPLRRLAAAPPRSARERPLACAVCCGARLLPFSPSYLSCCRVFHPWLCASLLISRRSPNDCSRPLFFHQMCTDYQQQQSHPPPTLVVCGALRSAGVAPRSSSFVSSSTFCASGINAPPNPVLFVNRPSSCGGRSTELLAGERGPPGAQTRRRRKQRAARAPERQSAGKPRAAEPSLRARSAPRSASSMARAASQKVLHNTAHTQDLLPHGGAIGRVIGFSARHGSISSKTPQLRRR